MTVEASASALGRSAILEELAKLPAFLRRDLLVALSYRVAFLADVASLVTQAVLFALIGRLVDSSRLPVYGGERVGYLEFAVIGISLAVFVQIGLGRVAAALRSEQLVGTLESVLATPTSSATVQLGSVLIDLVYVPIRTAVFLGVMVAAFSLDLRAAGILPATAALVAAIPFVWGLGLVGAAGVLTFRRGLGATGVIGTFLALGSGAYFPLSVLPDTIARLAKVNPVAIALDDMRGALLGDLGWGGVAHDLPALAAGAAASLALGLLAFRWALARERRNGSLGLY